MDTPIFNVCGTITCIICSDLFLAFQKKMLPTLFVRWIGVYVLKPSLPFLEKYLGGEDFSDKATDIYIMYIAYLWPNVIKCSC
jgi:hypothetical protein